LHIVHDLAKWNVSASNPVNQKDIRSNYIQWEHHLFCSWLPVIGANEIKNIFVLACTSTQQSYQTWIRNNLFLIIMTKTDQLLSKLELDMWVPTYLPNSI